MTDLSCYDSHINCLPSFQGAAQIGSRQPLGTRRLTDPCSRLSPDCYQLDIIVEPRCPSLDLPLDTRPRPRFRMSKMSAKWPHLKTKAC